VTKTIISLVAVIILALQFAVIVPMVMNDTAFRHQERLEAHKAMSDNPTSATQAAFQREMELEQYHRTHDRFARGVLYFCGLAIFEGAVFYFWLRHRKRTSA
jgi:hypothetical protein